VAYFLFDLGRGYFDYHASAMVVMLRSLGIPSRLAVGYALRPEDRQPNSNSYRLTEQSTFAWPEVYFAGLGWIEFNPTPSLPRITRAGDGGIAATDPGNEEVLPEEPVIEIDPSELGPATLALDEVEDEGPGLVSRIIASVLLLFVGITVLGGAIFQYGLQRGLGGYDYPVQVWEKTMRLARWARIRPPLQATPREITAHLRRSLPEVDDLDYVGESFIRSRYGRKQLGPQEKERLTDVWKQARNTLVSRIFRFK
jgi:hypothetical protein